MNDTTKPMASTIHECASLGMAPMSLVAPLWWSALYRVYRVAASITGNETKNENSSAAGRLMPANSPAVMVDMEREVPGKTAENIWQKPIQTACQTDICSMSSVSLPCANALCFERS